MPRFVLLYHDCPPSYPRPSHWDFMLDSGDTLRTWALPQLPSAWHVAHAFTAANYPNCPELAVGNQVSARQLGSHRRDFLEFEGPLSGNRGSVCRVAEGTFHEQSETQFGCYLTLESDAIKCGLKLDRDDELSEQWTLALRSIDEN
jgi:hypothetical protein